MLDGETASCWNVENSTSWWGCFVAAAIMLEPPVLFGKLIERLDGEIVVLIVSSWESILAVYSICEGSDMSICDRKKDGCCAKHYGACT